MCCACGPRGHRRKYAPPSMSIPLAGSSAATAAASSGRLFQVAKESMRIGELAASGCRKRGRTHPLHGLLAASAAHTGAVHHEALLGLEAHAAGLVRAGGVGHTHDGRQLPVLPAAHAQQEAEHIALLLLPQLLNVLHEQGQVRTGRFSLESAGSSEGRLEHGESRTPCKLPWRPASDLEAPFFNTKRECLC